MSVCVPVHATMNGNACGYVNLCAKMMRSERDVVFRSMIALESYYKALYIVWKVEW
jgi:hypothetical protein